MAEFLLLEPPGSTRLQCLQLLMLTRMQLSLHLWVPNPEATAAEDPGLPATICTSPAQHHQYSKMHLFSANSAKLYYYNSLQQSVPFHVFVSFHQVDFSIFPTTAANTGGLNR